MPHRRVGVTRVIRAPNAGIDAGDRRAPVSSPPPVSAPAYLRSRPSSMYSSPCSLRSTQCATLITLAAAAGIPRTEQPTAPIDSAPPTPTVVSVATRVTPPPQFFQLAAAAPAPWLRPATAQPAAPAPDEAPSPPAGYVPPPAPCVLPPPAPAALHVPRPLLTAAHSVRRHSHPYALGPPPRGSLSVRRRSPRPTVCPFACAATPPASRPAPASSEFCPARRTGFSRPSASARRRTFVPSPRDAAAFSP